MAELKLQRHMRKYAVNGIANPLGPTREGNAGPAGSHPTRGGGKKKSKAKHKSRSLFKQLLEQHSDWEHERQQASQAMQAQQKFLTDASFSATAGPAKPPSRAMAAPSSDMPASAIFNPAAGAENVDPEIVIPEIPGNLSSDVQELYSSMIDFGLISQNLGLHDFPSETTALSDSTPFATTDSEPASADQSEAEP